jgi:hypothetical protein
MRRKISRERIFPRAAIRGPSQVRLFGQAGKTGEFDNTSLACVRLHGILKPRAKIPSQAPKQKAETTSKNL